MKDTGGSRKFAFIVHKTRLSNHWIRFIAETDDDCIDEGIDEGDKRWDDDSEEERNDTKELEHIIEVGLQFAPIGVCI